MLCIMQRGRTVQQHTEHTTMFTNCKEDHTIKQGREYTGRPKDTQKFF